MLPRTSYPTPHAAAGLALTALLLLAVAGCSGAEESPPGEAMYATFENPFVQDLAERDSVLSAIAALDQTPIRQAYQQLAAYRFTRYFRTEQLDESAYLIAFRERTTRHSGLPGNRRYDVTMQDSSGAFEFGFFERFVSATTEKQDPRDLAPYLLPEDPAYLAPQNYDAYLYRFRPDTLMATGQARVIEARALPEAGDGKNIRRVQLFVDDSTNALVAVRLERIDLALFFREESTFYLHLQQLDDGAWVPLNTRFESLIVMPFRPPQLFRTVASFTAFAPIEQEVPALP